MFHLVLTTTKGEQVGSLCCPTKRSGAVTIKDLPMSTRHCEWQRRARLPDHQPHGLPLTLRNRKII